MEPGCLLLFTEDLVEAFTVFEMCCAGLHMREEGIELRPAQYYTQHAAGIYQGAKPGKLKGLAHANQSVHRVSASLQANMGAFTVVPLRMDSLHQ